jgi:hypothetical protein
MIVLLYFLDDYGVVAVKKYLKIYKKYDYRTINELQYIISAQRVITDHNIIHWLI